MTDEMMRRNQRLMRMMGVPIFEHWKDGRAMRFLWWDGDTGRVEWMGKELRPDRVLDDEFNNIYFVWQDRGPRDDFGNPIDTIELKGW